ncbi:Rieske 2Fe-2S domain-containing protein [Ekhidna sp.]|uniref:Rieske 2Fe-2S domain-containing protein n=1 Tax=Ekhidna sp. TaxID=2608089 RepID=UPI003298B0F9
MAQLADIPPVGKFDKIDDIIIGTIKFDGECPIYAVKLDDTHCVVAFSQKCPHMGCSLTSINQNDLPKETENNGIIRCNCHFSSFDLLANGLTIIGPATDWLALRQLRRSAADDQKIEILEWINNGDIGSGIAYGSTSTN